MKQKRKAIWLAAGVISALGLLQGCGGGGGSSSPRVLSGVFLDAKVAGLAYRTESQSGTTDADGRFSYLPGETVTFSLGSLELGAAAGGAEITLLDMSELSDLPSAEDAIENAIYDNGLPGPLNRVINMAVLLQSLDADANLDNGIEIAEAVIGYLDETAIDLDDFYYDFVDDGNIRNGRGLRAMLRRAAAANDLPARATVHPALALQHFYETLGLVPEIWRYTAYSADYDGNGAADNSFEQDYVSSGAFAGQRSDNDGDGRFEYITAYQRDDNLAELLYSVDDDGDGTAERVKRTNYDSFGAMVATETVDAGGVVLGFEQLSYDEQGRLLRRELRSGSTHFIQHWLVDEAGMRSIYEFDEDADGQIDVRSTLAYDGNERSDWWVARDNDSNLDGVADSRQTRQLDDQGRILSSINDSDLDGLPDYELQQRFDERGRLTRQAVDNDGGGFDRITERAYDDSLPGYIQTIDADADGSVDAMTRYTFTDQGALLSREEDSAADGVYERVTRNSFDASGRQVGSEETVDGVVERLTEHFYDAAGNLERIEIDRGADGTIDQRDSYSGYVSVGLAALL